MRRSCITCGELFGLFFDPDVGNASCSPCYHLGAEATAENGGQWNMTVKRANAATKRLRLQRLGELGYLLPSPAEFGEFDEERRREWRRSDNPSNKSRAEWWEFRRCRADLLDALAAASRQLFAFDERAGMPGNENSLGGARLEIPVEGNMPDDPATLAGELDCDSRRERD
jgi:hypothetical protein